MAVTDMLDITEYGKSSANLKAKFIDTLRARFDSSRTDGAEPSPLNAGIIGLTLDMNANAIEDAYFESVTRGKEIFVASAKFDDSIYTEAASCKINEFFAKPAAIDILIGIPTSDIIDHAIPVSGGDYSKITLSAKTHFILDNYVYMLDYPVDITYKKTQNSEKSIFSCKYVLTNPNQFSDVNSTYIVGVIQVVDGMEYYVFKVRAHQVKLTSERQVFLGRANAADIFEYDYENQLAGFEVFWRQNNKQSWTKLENIYNGMLVSKDQKIAYYRLGDQKIEISFPNASNKWHPEINNQFLINIYTTNGKDGNFNYTSSDVAILLQQDSGEVYEAAFSGITPAIQLASSTSSGGEDMPTIDSIRQRVISFKASREVIISDKDLLRIIKQYGFNIVKQRDDILMRQFVTYALLQNKAKGFTLPGRTSEIQVGVNELQKFNETDSLGVPSSDVFQFWLADDAESENISRFVCKQPQIIETTSTAKTDAYRMSVGSSHNVEFLDNKGAETAVMVLADNMEFESNRIYDNETICFYGGNVNEFELGNYKTTNTVEIYLMSNTNDVLVKLNLGYDNEVLNRVTIKKGYRYRIKWNLNKWILVNAEDPLAIDDSQFPDEDGKLPTIQYLEMPAVQNVGTEFYFVNHTEKTTVTIGYRYVNEFNQNVLKTVQVPVHNVVKFTADYDSQWTIEKIGLETDNLTPTLALKNKNWTVLYQWYEKYGGMLMMCPFVIRVLKNPYMAALYNVCVNTSATTVFKYNNTNSYEKFSVNSISVVRKSILDNYYEVTCALSVSDTIYNAFLETDDMSNFPVRLKVEFLKSDGSSFGYFSLKQMWVDEEVPNKIYFSSRLRTQDMISAKDWIYIDSVEDPDNPEYTYIVPTDESTFLDGKIKPSAPQRLAFSSKLRVNVIYQPDFEITNEESGHLLTDDEKNNLFIVSDIFETEDEINFVQNVSDIFATRLNVIKTAGEYFKYSNDIYQRYEKTEYKKDENGMYETDANGDFIILHNAGEIMYRENSSGMMEPIVLHYAGEPILDKFDKDGNLILAKDPETTFILANVPLVSITAILDDETREMMYTLFSNTIQTIKDKVLSKFIENNQIVCSIYNTVGPASKYVQGYKNQFSRLKNLDISISINVRFKNTIKDNDTSIVSEIKNSIVSYLQQAVADTGNLYMYDMLEYIKNLYNDIEYIEFDSINGESSEVQTVQNEDNDENGSEIPEYITVAQTLDKDAFCADGTIILTPNIDVNVVSLYKEMNDE